MKAFYYFLAAIFCTLTSQLFAHSVQVRYCTSCDGDLRIWIEHWHDNEDPSTTTMTIDLTVNGVTTTMTSTPGGSVMNLPFGQLPGCSSTSIYAGGCPDQNSYNDWVYYDFTGIPQNVPASFTIISGNTMFTMDGCGMYPLTVDFIIDNSLNLPDIILCEGESPGPVQIGGGASWTNNNPAIGLPASGNGAVQNFTPIGPPGTVATITYTSNCNTGSYDYIIAPDPETNFNVFSNGNAVTGTCLGNTFNFVDASYVDAPQVIDSWQWNFGDGNFSNQQNPSHTYANPGVYTVTLITNTNEGCESSSYTQQVTVYDLPQADFTSNIVCPNQIMTLTDNSTVNSGVIAISTWDVFNDNSLDHFTPTANHVFSQSGTHDVLYTATSNFGCVGSILGQVEVAYVPEVNFVSDSVCLGNPTSFTDVSTVQNATITEWEWDFGSGISTQSNPQFTFGSAGSFPVSLTTTSNYGCSASVNANAVVFDLPTAEFTVENECMNNDVTITNLSAANLSYLWDFGDNNTSTMQNPIHQYSSSGQFQIDLTVTSNQNCQSTSSQNIVIYDIPVVNFNANDVCANDVMTFVNQSSVNYGTLTNWQWDILNDNSVDYSTQHINHTFNEGGVYDVLLSVESSYGCENSQINQVNVNYLPIANFISDTVCLGNPTQFFDASSIIGATNTNFTWNFGQGNIQNGNNTTYQFNSAGEHNVSLLVTSSQNCSTTIDSNVFVYDLPVAEFAVNDACMNVSISPLANPTSISTFEWDFGDGHTATVESPSHLYQNAGLYPIELTVTSTDNCTNQTLQQVHVYDLPQASFTVDTTCLGTNSNYVNTSFIPNVINNDNIINWQWDVDGDLLTDFSSQNLIYEHTSEGFHNTTLIVTTLNGCKDTITDVAAIWPKPEVNFTFENVCHLDSTEFTQQSSVSNLYTYNVINDFLWNFGDGTLCNCNDPIHQFQNVDSYGTKLAAITNHGCFNETINVVTINPVPTANFSFTDACEGQTSTQFEDLSQIESGNISSWSWTFGDDNQSTGQMASNFYADAGIYDVTLTLNSDQNCSNEITIPVTVYENPTALFTSDLTQICGANDIQFTDLSHSGDAAIVAWHWDFGDETTTYNQNPNHIFYNESSQSASFDISLTVTNEHGCYATFTAEDYVEVYSQPIASFNYNPTMPTVTEPEVEFYNQSLNADEYAWNFGDYITSIEENPTHEYSGDEPGAYPVQLIAYNNSQTCSDTTWVTVHVEDVLIFYVPNAFTPDGDSYNNVWQPQFYSGYDPYDYHCTIFNRWGEVIWESYDASKGWDGHYGGTGLVQDGVYVWKINFNESTTAKNREYMGHVTVLK